MRRAPNELYSSGFDFEADEEDNRCSEACREGEEKEKKKVKKEKRIRINQSRINKTSTNIFLKNDLIIEGNQKTRKKSKKSLTKQNKELNLNYDR